MVLIAEAVTQMCFANKVVLQFREIHRKKPVIESLKEETLSSTGVFL